MFPTAKTRIILIAAALLGSVFAGAAPSASARTSPRMFTVTFAYNTAEPAETIYQELKGVAHRACHERTTMSYPLGRSLRRCTREVIEATLQAMVRTDVAAMHTRGNV